MPAGFNTDTAKNYLECRWGLGPQRQNAVLSVALVIQPASRLTGPEDAKAFFDDAAEAYALQAGIQLATSSSEDSQQGNGGHTFIDPAALEEFSKAQRNLSSRQLEILAAHLELDIRAPEKGLLDLRIALDAKQAEIDLWKVEHGESYSRGISPAFSSLKMRTYDSYWNWVRDDILSLYYDLISPRIGAVEVNLKARIPQILNRAGPKTMDFLRYLFSQAALKKSQNHAVASKVGLDLLKAFKSASTSAPVFKIAFVPTAPRTTIDAKGDIHYIEAAREAEMTAQDYVQVMCDKVARLEQEFRHTYSILLRQSKQFDVSRIKSLDSSVEDALPLAFRVDGGRMTPPEDDVFTETTMQREIAKLLKPETYPFLYLKQLKGTKWEYSVNHSKTYLNCLSLAARSGITFQGKTALVTGSGVGSIGVMVLEGLISGGATVIATTSNFCKDVTEYYRNLYKSHGARGSRLIVLPFNQSSKQDVKSLIEHIYNAEKGLGLDLDYVLPFAAISETNSNIDSIDSRSELAHRMMLTNLLRLLGFIKKHKSQRYYITRPCQVILPLSPNHGTFGGDGLYSESKIALETLFNKWGSEKWATYLTLCGANIGWTRGTGLMSVNDLVAEGIENLGVRTFSQKEMAFNILGLMTPPIRHLCETEPVFADLTGSLESIPDLKTATEGLRAEILERSETRKLLVREDLREAIVTKGETAASLHGKNPRIEPQANLDLQFPHLPNFRAEIAPLGTTLNGMVDLEKVVVVTGISELGPFGNSRTRWEMEAYGKFSIEGCIEMAWIMGLIKHHHGPIKGREGKYSGWIDSKTGQPLGNGEIRATYEERILQHSGIRVIDPSMLEGRDNRMMQEVLLQEDLAPFEASKENALDFQKRHGDRAYISPIAGSKEYHVRLKAGAVIMVPRDIDNEHLVAAQIPTGWDARRFGISEDIINQVDKVTLYVLVCTAEALLSAGIADPYEFYQHVHVSEVANCIGSGIGGADALRSVYKDRALDKSVQNDILQETFINTISAWVNMLLLSSSGPIKTPVGACATALESINMGYETIITGEARICLVGGCDSFQEETAREFGNLKATSNPKSEAAQGRVPKEMSRPNTSTRSGFVESEGCGIQVLTTARLALDMGLPIRGIIALATTASDKIGRSVPAPGQGILVNAREELLHYKPQLLDPAYRKRQLEYQMGNISLWEQSEVMPLPRDTAEAEMKSDMCHAMTYIGERSKELTKRANRLRKEAQSSWGNDFWRRDSHIAPLRGALAVWGLTVDDLGIASLHGTSTPANDRNESDILCKQLRHLGRHQGNAILAISQKYLTGHPKGAAGAWMLNGAVQVLDSGLVPGNRNADNIDHNFEDFDLMHYPGRSIQTDGIKAFSATSFGFGQKSAQVIGVHPRYLFATLDEASYETYKSKAQTRQQQTHRHFSRRMITNSIFQAKEKPPYVPALETRTLLSPNARATACKDNLSYSFSSKATATPDRLEIPQTEEKYQEEVELLARTSQLTNVRTGVDIEDIEAISTSETFITRNFTEEETTYCRAASSPQASFAGRWCAKEAVFKALGVTSKGAGAAMKDIEIINNEQGAPVVKVILFKILLDPICDMSVPNYISIASRRCAVSSGCCWSEECGGEYQPCELTSHSDRACKQSGVNSGRTSCLLPK